VQEYIPITENSSQFQRRCGRMFVPMQPHGEQRTTEPELVLASESNAIFPAEQLAPVPNGPRPPRVQPEPDRKPDAREITGRRGVLGSRCSACYAFR
jgi:hypothetical protein